MRASVPTMIMAPLRVGASMRPRVSRWNWRAAAIANRFYGSRVLLGRARSSCGKILVAPDRFPKRLDVRERHEIYEPVALALNASRETLPGATRSERWSYREKRWARPTAFQNARGPEGGRRPPLQLYLPARASPCNSPAPLTSKGLGLRKTDIPPRSELIAASADARSGPPAERIALDRPGAGDQPETIARPLRDASRRLSALWVFHQEALCDICSDTTRAVDLLCVVEQPTDIAVGTSAFRGRYHSLGGRIAARSRVPTISESSARARRGRKFGSYPALPLTWRAKRRQIISSNCSSRFRLP